MGENNTEDLGTTQQVPNPTGKGGFGDHPENRNPGGWNPDFTFSYQYKRFLHMNADKFLAWDKETPDSEKKVVETIAWAAVYKARKDLRERQEIANRTEGMPKQSVDIDIKEKPKFVMSDETDKV